ncbi:MAG: hypothetical protein M1817_004420 [Caeruleum heppii]|nr:MAG: hypothetical protein M1817_004420 [Caeruleum heppii]
MGRQAYLTRLALGRSAFEPYEPPPEPREQHTIPSSAGYRLAGDPSAVPYHQQYDSRGHPTNPESRRLLRASVRAQNEVLATCGVIKDIRDQEDALNDAAIYFQTDVKDVERVIRENHVGAWLPTVDIAATSVGLWGVGSLRQRLQVRAVVGDRLEDISLILPEQVFRRYRTVSLSQLLHDRWHHVGLASFFLAGWPAHFLYENCRNASELVLGELDTLLINWEVGEEARLYLWHFLDTLTFMFLSPLPIFSILQSLGLLPAYPVLPNAQAMIPFSSKSPLQLPTLPYSFSLSSAAVFALSLIRSPLPVLFIVSAVDARLKDVIYDALRDILPRPDRPDVLSIQAALEQGLDVEGLPGFEPEPSVDEDQELPPSRLAPLRDWVLGLFGNRPAVLTGPPSDQESRPIFEQPPVSAQIPSAGLDQHADPESNVPHTPHGYMNLTFYPELSPGGSHSGHDPHDGDDTDNDSDDSDGDDDSSSSSAAAAPQDSPGTRAPQSDDHFQPPDDSDAAQYFELGRRRARDSTEPPLHSDELPPVHSPSSTHPSPTTPQRPHHRVTALSTFPWLSLNTHLAHCISNVISLPLEALLVRTVAVGFLASSGQTPAVIEGLYQPREIAWRGGYVTKMAVVLGLEVGVRFVVWEGGLLAARWWGLRFGGWGRVR